MKVRVANSKTSGQRNNIFYCAVGIYEYNENSANPWDRLAVAYANISYNSAKQTGGWSGDVDQIVDGKVSTFTFQSPVELTKGTEYLVSFGTYSQNVGDFELDFWGTTPVLSKQPPFVTLWGRTITPIETTGVSDRTGWIGAGDALVRARNKSYRTKDS